MNINDKFEYKKYIYYGLVGVISLIMLVFMPMIGSSAEIRFDFPNTVAGWFIYIVTKLLIAILNILIFHCFMQQAKLNVKDDENFKEANKILGRYKNNLVIPRSPEYWSKKQYSLKVVVLFVFSALSTIALSNAILTYDYMSLMTYALTLLMGLIFGILQMKSAEVYWTTEYYYYAIYIKDKKITKKEIIKCLKSMEKNIGTWKSKS